MFTAIVRSRPASLHRRCWRSAASSTQRVNGSISSLRSASGMNCAGSRSPSVGCCQRTSASTPMVRRWRSGRPWAGSAGQARRAGCRREVRSGASADAPSDPPVRRRRRRGRCRTAWPGASPGRLGATGRRCRGRVAGRTRCRCSPAGRRRGRRSGRAARTPRGASRRSPRRGFNVGRAGREDAEVVVAQARYGVRYAHRDANPFGDRAEKGVASLASERPR